MLLIDWRELSCSVTDFRYNLLQVAQHWMILGFVNLFKPVNTFFLCYTGLKISLVTFSPEFKIYVEAIG